MLIQAYCQQEREKRCTITTQSEQSARNEKHESSDSKMDTNDSNDASNCIDDDTNTQQTEQSTTTNDVEMIDAQSQSIIPTIKQEPNDESNTNENSNQVASNDEHSDKIDNVESNQNDNHPVVKIEIDENGNDSNKDDKEVASNEPVATTADQSIEIEESSSTDKDDPYSKDINIDPRTYCKLGHFHLLLEDYPKGE